MDVIFKNYESALHPLTKYITITNYPPIFFFLEH